MRFVHDGVRCEASETGEEEFVVSLVGADHVQSRAQHGLMGRTNGAYQPDVGAYQPDDLWCAQRLARCLSPCLSVGSSSSQVITRLVDEERW